MEIKEAMSEVMGYFRRVCRCGAVWRGPLPTSKHSLFSDLWAETHSGPECGPATIKQAAQARRRADGKMEEKKP